MDYVVGSIAALLTGNVTPNRPKPLRNAQTPMKHQPSPNVTPKSEFVDDRSVFLSPTMQKKKAMVKKSPKRIFQNPDLDVTNGEENDSSLTSPKADKVKKHLKNELEVDSVAPTILMSPKSPKNKEMSPKKNKRLSDNNVNDEDSPKKKKPKSETGTDDSIMQNGNDDILNSESTENSLKKKVKKSVSAMEISVENSQENLGNNLKKKNKQQQNEFTVEEIYSNTSVSENQSPKKNKKKKSNKSKQNESTGNIKPNGIANESEKDFQNKEISTNAAITETQGPIKKKKNRKKKKSKQNITDEQIQSSNNTNQNSVTPMEVDSNNESKSENTPSTPVMDNHSPKKKNKKRNKSKQNKDTNQTEVESNKTDKVNTNIEIDIANIASQSENTLTTDNQSPKKKKKKSKKNKNQQIESNENDKVNPNSDTKIDLDSNIESKCENTRATDNQSPKKKKKQSKQCKNIEEIESNENVEVNPNAVTNQDTDSEHDSDDEIDSDNEEVNKKALDTGAADDSSDEAPEEVTINKKGEKKEGRKFAEEEIKRTLFVGNVPFSAKTKKEMKKMFSKYGQIESVRIRTVPVKDARDTPKMAVIKRELHPDRSTVHVYVRFTTANSVQKALVENNVVLNGCHLRVHPSDSTGVPHDPKCSIFVGNIPFTLEDEVLRAKFEKCGDIESIRIVRDNKTCIGKGFGYVNFKSKDGVELALALTEEDLTIKNRILRVKRCTQPTEKQLKTREYFNKPRAKDFGKKFGGGTQIGSGKKENFRRQEQGNRGNFGRPEQGNRGKFGRPEQGNRGNFGRQEQGNKGNFGRQEQGNRGNFGKNKFEQDDDKSSGAYRRVMNKRKNQESGDGPPNKRQNVDQPPKEKKERKEFVGMTAEKKKKNKFNKGQKKKKILSEILTK